MKEVSFKTSDDVTLDGFLYEAATPKAITVIHGATGVPVHYYKYFAKWLSKTHSRHVLIYDYRDNNLKSAKALHASETTMSDWGLKDQPASTDYMLREFPDLPLHIIGHSLGGFCIPYHANNDKIISHTGINSGAAYWKTHPWNFMIQTILFWFLLGPVVVKILGFLPGQILGMKTHIPKHVYWEWRKWCTHPQFYEPEWGKTLPQPDLFSFRGKLKLIACEDDRLIPPARVKYLEKFFPSAREPEFQILSPKRYGLKSIGHITIFAKKNSKVWPDLITE